jgi:UDP-N-acetyl-2-amino-2-deoxyglucuronate dehydrogenase
VTALLTMTRVVIIGVGGISNVYASALAAMSDGDCTLVAGCCRTEEKGRAFADKFGCKYYSDYLVMLDTERPDVAIITTPSGSHLEPTVACAERSVHVLSDKPLEITLERCDRMISACEGAGVQLGCIFQSRYTPGLAPLHAAAAAGRFGSLSVLAGYVPWWRADEYYSPSRWQGTQAQDGGGAVINQAIHTIDLLIWLAEAAMPELGGPVGGESGSYINPVAEVHAYTARRAHGEVVEVEDTAVATLRFRNGTLGQVLAATSMYPGGERLVMMAGRDGTAELRGSEITRFQFREPLEGDAAVCSASASGQLGNASDPLAGHDLGPITAMIASFVGSCAAAPGAETAGAASSPPPPPPPYLIPGREGRKALEVVLAMYESARTGQPAVPGLPTDKR